MAGIGGLTGGTSLSGFGGLASGLDRDELIKNMTYGTRSKIAVKKQSQDKMKWQQEAYREITGKMHELSQKYMSYSSSTNLLGSAMFSRNLITAMGANNGKISVSGTAAGATMSIEGIREMAQNTQMTTLDSATSGSALQTGQIKYNLDDTTPVNLISGENIYIEYGNKQYVVNLKDETGKDYDTPEDAVRAIESALSKIDIGNEQKLSDVLKVTQKTESGETKFTFTKDEDQDKLGGTLRIIGGTNNVLKNLGFLKEDEDITDVTNSRIEITKDGLTSVEKASLMEEQSIAKQLGGKSISFQYNGVSKWIELPEEDELKGKNCKDLKMILQNKLDEAFGAGRVKAELTNDTAKTKGHLHFSATKPTVNADGKVVPGDPDETSVLTITAADKGLLGSARLLGMEAGASNRLNLSTSFLKSGLVGASTIGSGGPLVLKINGKEIEVKATDSVKQILDKINNSDAGVNVTYQSNTDRFVMTAKDAGASGQIQLEGNVAKAMFGTKDDPKGYKVTKGHDAIIAVKYAGSDEVVEIERGSNTFTVDGLNITLKGTFGYKENATGVADLDPTSEAITFDAKVDSEKTTKAVKEMVDAFNEVLKLINTQANERPKRDYAPLTSEQREGLSESEIERWETEAKKGLLFGDSSMKGLEDAMRFVLPNADRTEFSQMGITVSTDYADRGKLVFQEDKFKAALEKNPDAVKDLFTKPSEKNEDGTEIGGGLMTKMKNVMEKYAGMTGSRKGILVEKAGSAYAPTTILKNSLQKQIDNLDDVIEKLNDQLKTEQDRYIRQFTSLETAISQMNSQSSWLSQFGGTAQ